MIIFIACPLWIFWGLGSNSISINNLGDAASTIWNISPHGKKKRVDIQTLRYLHLKVTFELCSWQIKIIYLAEHFRLENYKYINFVKMFFSDSWKPYIISIISPLCEVSVFLLSYVSVSGSRSNMHEWSTTEHNLTTAAYTAILFYITLEFVYRERLSVISWK